MYGGEAHPQSVLFNGPTALRQEAPNRGPGEMREDRTLDLRPKGDQRRPPELCRKRPTTDMIGIARGHCERYIISRNSAWAARQDRPTGWLAERVT